MNAFQSDLQTELAMILFQRGVPEFGEFRTFKLYETDPAAPPSPVRFNVRLDSHPTNPGPLTLMDFFSIASEMRRCVHSVPLDYNGVTGLPVAGDALVDGYVATTNGPVSRIRFEKAHNAVAGTRQITKIVNQDGLTPGDKILVFDDVVSAGHTKLEGIRLLREADFLVEDIIVLIDREQGGREVLEREGCRLCAVFTASELLAFGCSHGYVSGQQLQQATAYAREMRERTLRGLPSRA